MGVVSPRPEYTPPVLRPCTAGLRFFSLQFAGLPEPIFAGNTKETQKFRTFKMAWRFAGCCVAQPIAHGGQFPDFSVQLIGLGRQQGAIDVRPFGRKHCTDLIQRETDLSPQGYQRQPLYHVGAEQAA
jgi:hypothetical protein